MGKSKSKATVEAAKLRRDRDAEEAEATTPEQAQEMVSQHLYERGVREDRHYGD